MNAKKTHATDDPAWSEKDAPSAVQDGTADREYLSGNTQHHPIGAIVDRIVDGPDGGPTSFEVLSYTPEGHILCIQVGGMGRRKSRKEALESTGQDPVRVEVVPGVAVWDAVHLIPTEELFAQA